VIELGELLLELRHQPARVIHDIGGLDCASVAGRDGRSAWSMVKHVTWKVEDEDVKPEYCVEDFVQFSK
jgi:hypothetical protein